MAWEGTSLSIGSNNYIKYQYVNVCLRHHFDSMIPTAFLFHTTDTAPFFHVCIYSVTSSCATNFTQASFEIKCEIRSRSTI